MVKIIVKIVFIVAALQCFVSCKKDKCLIDPGEVDSLQLDIGSFRGVKFFGLFDVELIQDTVKKIIVQGPEKMLSNIRTEWESGDVHNRIRIYDENSCYWMRNYERMMVYVHSDTLRSVVLQGACKVTSRNTIHSPGIAIIALTDINEVNVNLHTNDLLFYNNGAVGGIYEFSGYAKKSHIYGYANARVVLNNFITDTCDVIHNSVANFHFDMQGPIGLSLQNTGHFYYYRDNPITIIEKSGSGTIKQVKAE
ncbi:MAG: hypothetical protein GVY19_13575 [Bacteroidetes bacterium]|jgi:hypothetical protein|nr:hypothetical protein [Bacteroidota bacterium]